MQGNVFATNEVKCHGKRPWACSECEQLLITSQKTRTVVNAENRDALMILARISEAMKYLEYGADETVARLQELCERIACL